MGDNPDFNRFFATTWQDLLERAEVPGFTGPVSWDRRAAYLLWRLGAEYDQTSAATGDWLDALAGGHVGPEPKRPPVGSPAPLLAPVIGRLPPVDYDMPDVPRGAAVNINFNSRDYPDGH